MSSCSDGSCDRETHAHNFGSVIHVSVFAAVYLNAND